MYCDRDKWQENHLEQIVQKYIGCFKPGRNITVDEQFCQMTCRCQVTQHTANKNQFGIKLWTQNTQRTHFLNAERPRCTRERLWADASHTSCFIDKGRNVVMDNFFTSLSLANKLIAKKTGLLRPMSKMRQELSSSVNANMLENSRQQQWWQLARQQLHCTRTSQERLSAFSALSICSSCTPIYVGLQYAIHTTCLTWMPPTDQSFNKSQHLSNHLSSLKDKNNRLYKLTLNGCWMEWPMARRWNIKSRNKSNKYGINIQHLNTLLGNIGTQKCRNSNICILYMSNTCT